MHGLYATQGPKLIELVLQKYTQRRNFGFFSLFESHVLEQKVVVVGVASRFIPVEGGRRGDRETWAIGCHPQALVFHRFEIHLQSTPHFC